MSAETGTSLRRSCGTAIAFLTWTTPSMSSQSSPRTGKREWPVRRDSRSTSSADSSRWMPVQRTRGVMTSSAVRSPKPSERVSMRAVVMSRVPASAERWTRLASSWGVRAPDSSSCGSMPSAAQEARWPSR